MSRSARRCRLNAGTLHIEPTLHYGTGSLWRIAEPKTERSRRSIELSPMASEALRRHRTRRLVERLTMGPAWQEDDFVFCNAIGEPLRGTHLLERHFLPSWRRWACRSHAAMTLRHTFVSLASAQGVPAQMISQMLGHSSPSMAQDVYMHILPGLGRAAALAMEGVLRGQQMG